MVFPLSSKSFFKTINWELGKQIGFFIAFFIALATIGGFVFRSVEKELKKNFSDQLTSILSANIKSLKNWVADKKLDAQVLAHQPAIRRKMLSLIKKAQPKKIKTTDLNQSEELQWLRKHLGEACRKYGYIGFVLLDASGLQVGALLKDPVGKRQLSERSSFFQRSLKGATVMSKPFFSEVALPDAHGEWVTSLPTMFISTPVKAESGEIAGVLAFRLRPSRDFSENLKVGRFGSSGETYAIDASGVMMTNSRFDERLKKIGLISDFPETSSILNVHIRDPGGNIMTGFRIPISMDTRPLTKMAASIAKGESGVDLSGYNDYRGVLVVGAWEWLPEINLGIATEENASEAFAPLKVVFRGLLVIFALLALTCVIALIWRFRQFYTKKRYDLINKKTEQSEAKIRAIVDNVIDGIITADEKGSIQVFNPAAMKIFGYQASEVLGENINMLMPEPYRSRHDEYMHKYVISSRSVAIGMQRELIGVRKDGSLFPIEIALTELVIDEKRLFTGVIRDISELKKQKMEMERVMNQNKLILESAGDGIYGLDMEGNTTFANPAAVEMLGYPLNELLGKPQHLLSHHSRADGTPHLREDCHIYAAFSSGKVQHVDNEVFWRRDGSNFPVEYVSTPIYEKGAIVGAVVTFKDITVRKKEKEELVLQCHSTLSLF